MTLLTIIVVTDGAATDVCLSYIYGGDGFMSNSIKQGRIHGICRS